MRRAKRSMAFVDSAYGPRPPLRSRRQMLAPVKRWSPGVKAGFVEAIAIGHLTEAEVMEAHNISADELAIWRENLRRGGVADLRLKTIQLRSFRPRVTPARTFEPAAVGA